MSEPDRIAVYIDHSIYPFAPTPTFEKTDRQAGWIVWPEHGLKSPCLYSTYRGHSGETVLQIEDWTGSEMATFVCGAAVALRHALAGRFGLSWELRTIPRLTCGGKGVVAAEPPVAGTEGVR